MLTHVLFVLNVAQFGEVRVQILSCFLHLKRRTRGLQAQGVVGATRSYLGLQNGSKTEKDTSRVSSKTCASQPRNLGATISSDTEKDHLERCRFPGTVARDRADDPRLFV